MVSGTRRVAVALAALVVLGAGAETAAARSFDLEGHRGTRGLRPENTLAAFGKAMEIGVTTLELDTGVTKDGVVVVSHERRISSLECQGPYVGKLIHELTYAQIQKLDCGTRHPADPSTDPFVGTQEAVPGTHMPSLAQVFQLVNRYGADRVQFDIETKRDPTLPKETVGPTTFAKKVIAVISRYHMTKRSVLQSFDWSTLQAARKIKPRLRRAALAQKATIFPGTPWTGGIDDQAQPVRRRPRARRGRQAPRAGPVGQLPRHHRRAHQRLAPPRADDHPVDRRRRRPTWRPPSTAASTASSPTTPTRPAT